MHKDVWDYDLGGQGSLVDFPTAAGLVPAIVLPSKQGDMYVGEVVFNAGAVKRMAPLKPHAFQKFRRRAG